MTGGFAFPVLLAQVGATFAVAGDPGAFLANILYAVAAVFFATGLRMLAVPRTARRGNLVASAGMLLAVVATLASQPALGLPVIIAGLVVGGAAGAVAAKVVPLTGMPGLVALLNGAGGLASVVVAVCWQGDIDAYPLDVRIAIALTLLLGTMTFFGSIVAFGKLHGVAIRGVRLGAPLTFPMQHPLNLVLAVIVILLGVVAVMNPAAWWINTLVILLAAGLGVLLSVPVSRANMPVVVSLLNSCSGLAACALGFVLQNTGLIMAGAVVGASSLVLATIMCKALDRSLVSVLAGGSKLDVAGDGDTAAIGDRAVRRMTPEEAAMVLEASQTVFIIPGYGMAVAQAQHAVAAMADQLAERGIIVKYGVHPLAGRMPGHMNVLLDEASVPPEQLVDLELNHEMEQCDVALVIGANDVVNPGTRGIASSGIQGLPAFEVAKARTVMICKRSLNPGFAGVENELFFMPNAVMLFGDAKKVVSGIVNELKGA